MLMFISLSVPVFYSVESSLERARVKKKKRKETAFTSVSCATYENIAEIENVIQRGNKRRRLLRDSRRRFRYATMLFENS